MNTFQDQCHACIFAPRGNSHVVLFKHTLEMGYWISHSSLCPDLNEQQPWLILFSVTSSSRLDLHGKIFRAVSNWTVFQLGASWRAAHIYQYLPVIVRSVSYSQVCHNRVNHTNTCVHICGSWTDLSHSVTFPLDIRCSDFKFSPRDGGDSSSPFLGESHKSSQGITGKRESALVSKADSRLFWFGFIFHLLILLPKWLIFGVFCCQLYLDTAPSYTILCKYLRTLWYIQQEIKESRKLTQ